MNSKLTVFVISLKNSSGRRGDVKKHLDSIGLKFEFFDAIYGKDLTEEQIDTLCDREAIIKSPGWLTPGAIGCALSHYYVYREIIKRNLPYALILEDDMLFSKDFVPCLETAAAQLRENELMTFYYQSWAPLKLVKQSKKAICGKYARYEPKDMEQPLGAVAYLITQDACKSFSKAILPIRLCADTWGKYSDMKAFQHFSCVYPRVVEPTDVKSAIDYITNSRLAGIMRWVDDNKVFPFYQLLKLKRYRTRHKMTKVEFV